MTSTLDGLYTYSLYKIKIAAYTTYPTDGKISQTISIKTEGNISESWFAIFGSYLKKYLF